MGARDNDMAQAWLSGVSLRCDVLSDPHELLSKARLCHHRHRLQHL